MSATFQGDTVAGLADSGWGINIICIHRLNRINVFDRTSHRVFKSLSYAVVIIIKPSGTPLYTLYPSGNKENWRQSSALTKFCNDLKLSFNISWNEGFTSNFPEISASAKIVEI